MQKAQHFCGHHMNLTFLKKIQLGQNESRGGWFVGAQEPQEDGERRGQIPH